jgi:Protein of unknown function (DUF1266)
MKTMLDYMKETWRNAGMDPDMMLDGMITQWKAAGMNPDMMLGQLNSQPALDMSSLMQAQQAMQNAIPDDDNAENDCDDNSDNPLTEWEGDEIPLSTNSDLENIEDIRAVICGANLSMLNNTSLNTLTTLVDERTKEDILQMLEAHWNIDNRASLLETIQWLEDGGHRGYFQKIWQTLQQIPKEEWAISTTKVATVVAEDGADPESVKEYTENLLEGLTYMKSLEIINESTRMDCTSWDLARAINLLRWGYDVGFISKDEALKKIRKYAQSITTAYNSWMAVSIGYILGFIMWNCDSYQLNIMLHNHYQLLNDSKSPWQLIDFC